MMSEEILSDGVLKSRSALGDVTNQVGKRGFSLISSSGLKSGDGYKKEEGSLFAKKECLRVEKFNKENSNKENVECFLRPHSSREINSLKGNVIASISRITCENKEVGSPDGGGNVTSDTVVQSIDAVRESCVSVQLTPTRPSVRDDPDARRETKKDERIESEVVGEMALKDKAGTSVSRGDGIDLSQDNLDSSKDEYLDCARFQESQESCIGEKGDGCSSNSMALIKNCSCSFCMKAAYIWSDLHYQDTKGRIAVLKKSQKEASILVQQHSRENGNGRYCQGNLNKSSKLESDLTDQWRLLFLHMEDIFVRESSQLEASLFTLKDLRDNCKTGLEPTDERSSEKQ